MALVHAVKPLKHPVLVFVRDADAGIRHGQDCFSGAFFCCDGHAAAGAVILHGVVAEVIDKLLQRRADTLHNGFPAAERERHIPPQRCRAERGKCLLRKRIEIDALLLRRGGILFEARKLDDIVHERHEPLGFLVDIPGELPHPLRRHHAVCQKLGKAGDRRERRFELVRHVCGKFTPQRLALFPLCRVECDDNGAGDLVFGKYRRGDHVVIPLVHLERQLRAPPGESALCSADDLRRAAAAVEVVRLAVFGRGQKIAGRHIAGEHVQALIEQEEALPHILRDRGKVAPRLAERFLLLADQPVLRADTREQRHELFIRCLRTGGIRVDLPNGVYDAARHRPAARRSKTKRNGQHPQKARERLRGLLRPGKLRLHDGERHGGAEQNCCKKQNADA